MNLNNEEFRGGGNNQQNHNNQIRNNSFSSKQILEVNKDLIPSIILVRKKL
jgi:hypothetical protein